MSDMWRWSRLLREKWATAKRDLRSLGSFLSAETPPPSFPVSQRPTRRVSVGDGRRSLRVLEVVRETENVVTFVLGDPSGLPIPCLPGQFFTVLFPLQGRTERRAYSASTYVANHKTLSLTVKRQAEGRVSTALHDTLRPGMFLQVMGPSGRFTLNAGQDSRRRLVLIGGGSGITPLHCILQSVLAEEKDSQVVLIYGNRSSNDIVFRESLSKLSEAFPERFALRHVVVKAEDGFPATVGILDRTTVALELLRLPDDDGTVQYYICGPQGMMDAARSVLREKGVQAERIHEEHFATPQLEKTALPKDAQSVEVSHEGQVKTVWVEPDETILEAGLRNGLSLPFSCTMGGCGACKGELLSGNALLSEPNCLSEQERTERQILLCVAHPTGSCRVKVP